MTLSVKWTYAYADSWFMNTPCRVLLVEDEPGDAHLVRQFLLASREPRFDIVSVATLAEARRHLQENPPDVLLLDLSLPDSSGLDTVRAGRQAAGGLPIIVLTGRDDTAFALQTIEAGAQDYLIKGNFDTNALVRAIRYAIERKQAEARQRLAARVFETTGEAIMVTDTDANIVAVNPAFTRITGYSEAEVLGKNPRILDSERHNEAFHESMWQTLIASGEWTGEVWNRRKNGEVFPEWQTVSSVRDEAGKVTHYVAVFADLSEIRNAQQTAEHLSWRDALTGLANRAQFLKQLEQTLVNAQRESRFGVVLLLDLDRFKDINEARGLAVGDALLKAVAERLTQILHPDDLLARLDSDEFAVLPPRLAATREVAGREALAVAEKLRAALRESIEVTGETFHLDASIGIALFPESPRETASNALRQADMAMHQAKAEGGGRAVFFEAAMGVTVKDRYRLERELRLAVAENQLRLYLQPQVNAAALQVGAEALVRWQHPARGLVPPGMFIPLAETSDLIVAIDRWMLAEVCRLLARLDAEYPPGHTGRTLRVSVNISPRHFQKHDFVDEVKRQLAASGADPSRLVLEVTEGLVIGNFTDVVAKMTALTALGIHFSMDDFGTGYSSLAYLKRLPIHELKIDKSFIDDVTTEPNDAALVETIIAVTTHLHLQVVAEGVETQAQADFLNARGEVIHQGYLYGHPEPVEAWQARLSHEDLPRSNTLWGINGGESAA